MVEILKRKILSSLVGGCVWAIIGELTMILAFDHEMILDTITFIYLFCQFSYVKSSPGLVLTPQGHIVMVTYLSAKHCDEPHKKQY